MASKPELSIVIPAWNARELLAESLPLTLAALAADGVAAELVVIDNASSDGTAAWLAERYPDARVTTLPANEGFVLASNRGVRLATASRVLLLNADMALEPGFARLVLPLLADDRVFAVDSRIIDWETGADCEGARQLRHGVVWLKLARRVADGPVATAYATGGGCVIDREKFLALGGFAELFAPGYAEDYDLSLRAWRHGWRVLHQPQAVTRHRQQQTWRQLIGEARRRRLLMRNLWLLHWRHLSWPCLLLQALCWPLLAALQTLRYGLPALHGALAALPLLPRALAQRVNEGTLGDVRA
ncbi:MAG TPA: glycosyltransferase [bacterium]|nr:glycosyltransferase [bacterium]